MRTFWVLILAALTLPAYANEALIRKVLEPKLGGAKIEGVQPGPLGLWEVRFRGEDGVRILYTDAAASHIIVGKIYDAKTDRDLTETRMRRLNAINMSSLPLNQAVKVQRGNGKRMLVMFSDPYCPYCRTFEAALQQINDVTIYVFMIPLIKPDLADHSRAVWCSKDRAKAWIDLALHGKPPAGTSSCDNPVDKNLELGQKLGVNSTPTVYLANGERFAGAIQAAELRKLLDEVASSK